jgi:hypothetical protein
VLSYRQIFVIMGAVTLLAAAYIAVLLRHQIVDDVRRPPGEVTPADSESPLSAAVPTLDV